MESPAPPYPGNAGQCAGCSTTLDTNNSDRGLLAGPSLAGISLFEAILNRHAKNTGKAYDLKMAAGKKKVCTI